MSRDCADALGDRGAGGQHHDVAEADQRADRAQRPAIDRPPPAAEQRVVGARQRRHQAALPAPACATSAAKRSPRASKPVNWSKLAQAGDSSTTGARAGARGGERGGHRGCPACRRSSMRHAVRGERRGEQRRVAADQERAARCAGKSGASGSMPPSLAMPPAIQITPVVAGERARGGIGIGRLAVVDEAHAVDGADALLAVRQAGIARDARARWRRAATPSAGAIAAAAAAFCALCAPGSAGASRRSQITPVGVAQQRRPAHRHRPGPAAGNRDDRARRRESGRHRARGVVVDADHGEIVAALAVEDARAWPRRSRPCRRGDRDGRR